MIRIVVLCVIAIQIVNGFKFNQNCAKGPAYWCQNVITANECNAFKHCTQDVWSKHEKYLVKSESISAGNPSKCLNCLQCISADLQRCPIIRDYSNEINELISYKLPNEVICQLIEQCDPKMKSEQRGSNPIDLLNVEADNDPRFECGLHPRNWCTSIATAKRCNAFNTCLANWSKSNAKFIAKPIENNNDFKSKEVMNQRTCGFCIFVFTKLQSVIEKNSTETYIKSYLESACSILPSKTETENCLKSIDNYLPEIFNIVRNNVDPGLICRVLDVCRDKDLQTEEKSLTKEWTPIDISKVKVKIINENEAMIKGPASSVDKPLVSKLSATNGVGCELCIITMSVAKYLVTKKVDNTKIINFIETELCARLGQLNETCVDYFQAEGVEILQLLEREILSPENACVKSGCCGRNQIQSNGKAPFFDLQASSSSNCTLCKMIVMEAKSMILNQKKEAEIIDYINTHLCEKVGSNKELCKSLINAYGPMFFELIKRDVQPDQICALIGLCPKDDVKPKADPTCVMCEFVISLLTKRINPNSTKEQIQKDLDYVCTVAMPKQLREECTTFVDKYGPAIADIIIEEITPDNVCELLGLCISQKKVVEKPETDQTCKMCEFLANMLSKIVDKNMNEAEIIKDLEHVCNSTMPASWRFKCDRFVDTYGPQIVQLIIKETSPELICQLIGACTSQEKEHVHTFDLIKPKSSIEFDERKSSEVKSNSTCVMCEFVVTLLSKLVNENSTEPEMVKELEFLCNYTMPSTWRGQCNEFVDAYGPKIIDYLIQEIDPEAICALIDLCPSPAGKKINQQLIGQDEKNSNLIKNYEMPCVVCQYVVQFLSNQIEIDRTEAVLEIAVKHVCQLTPNSYRKYCQTMIDSHGHKLVSLIDTYKNSQDVCYTINHCQLNNKQVEYEQTELIDLQPATVRNVLNKETYAELFQVQTLDSNTTLECQLCVYVAQLANHFLKQNKTEEEILGELKLVCNFFPNDLKDQCNSFINEYGPYMIQLIADDIDPSSTCQALKLCDAQKSEKKKFASYIIQYRIRPRN